jgi:hypothetical protein
VAVSFALTPSPWPTWIEVLRDNSGRSGTWAAVPVPLTIRLPLGVALVIWGARSERRWTVPVAAMLALPALWYGSLAMLLAVIPLTTRGDRDHALAVLSSIVVRLGDGVRHGGREVARAWLAHLPTAWRVRDPGRAWGPRPAASTEAWLDVHQASRRGGKDR